MINLIVDNVSTKIQNAQQTILNSINKVLTVNVDGAWFSPAYKSGRWDGTVGFFDKKNNSFPTGLLYEILELLDDFGEDAEYKIIDNRTCKEFMLDDEYYTEFTLASSGKTLRDYQVESVNNVANNKLKNMKWQRGILNLATNAGKTTIAESVIQLIYPKLCEKYDFGNGKEQPIFMFITHSKEIMYQTKKTIESDLGIPVGVIGDGVWKEELVTIGMTTTLAMRQKSKKLEYISLARRVVGFIGDEAHHGSSDTYNTVLNGFTNAVIRLGLSGTVEKDDSRRLKIFGAIGPVITKVNNNYLIKHGYSANPQYWMVPIDYPNVDDIIIYNENVNQYNQIYDIGIVNNMWRNYIIVKLCEMEVFKNHGQVLVFVDRLEHGANICECFDYIDSKVKRQFLYGDLTSEERQEGLNKLVNKELDVIISTSILDEGIDVPNINALIYARGGRSIRKMLQGVGRGLRKKSDNSDLRVYDFLDDTSYVLVNQSKQRLNIMIKEKFTCKKLSTKKIGITDDEFQRVMIDLDRSVDYKL